MKPVLALVACCTALLVLAAPAAAKEVTKVEICGASRCTTITDSDELRLLPTGGEATAEQPPPAGYYTVTFTVDHGAETNPITMYYAPAPNLLAGNPEFPGSLTWFGVYGPATDVIRDAVDGIDPFPAPKRWPSEIRPPARTPAASVARSDGDGRFAAGTTALVGGAAALATVAAMALLTRLRRRPGRPADSPTTG